MPRFKEKPERWIHPIHGKGVQSQKFPFGHVMGKLTDKKINKYRSRGWFSSMQPYENPDVLKILKQDNLTAEEKEWKIRALLRKR
jgi:hypothetical protein